MPVFASFWIRNVGMGGLLFLLGSFVFGLSIAGGQTLSPEKEAEMKARFDKGYELQLQGKYVAARAIYESILDEVPTARRSLLEAGRCSVALFDFSSADNYLQRLHALEPDFPTALELLIQANQSLGRDVKVEEYRAALKGLHDRNPGSDFADSLIFVRQRVRQGENTIIFTESFHYDQAPFAVWRAQRINAATGKVTARIALKYDPDATKAIRAKDPRLARVEEFLLLEEVIKGDRITAVNAYMQYFALPEFKPFRDFVLQILANPPKPIYSESANVPVPDLMDANAP